MSIPRPPRRQKKGDRLLNPGARKEEIQCDYGVAPLDRVAREYDRKWGIDRLPELVSPETAEKYGYSIARLNEALEATDPEQCKAWAAVCIRGLHAMDAEAAKAGRLPASGKYLEHEHEGFKFGVLFDGAEWQTAQAERPDLKFYTMQEVAVALKAVNLDNPLFAEAKRAFPKAEVTNIKMRTPLEIELGDDIPF